MSQEPRPVLVVRAGPRSVARLRTERGTGGGGYLNPRRKSDRGETADPCVSSWCSEPVSQGVTQSGLRTVPYPGDISVGPDQHGCRSGDLAKYRKLPRADILSIDQLDPVSPRRDLNAPPLTEVEQHRLGLVQQREDPQRAVSGHKVQIGHAASEQGVA